MKINCFKVQFKHDIQKSSRKICASRKHSPCLSALLATQKRRPVENRRENKMEHKHENKNENVAISSLWRPLQTTKIRMSSGEKGRR